MARYRYGDGRIGKPLLHYDMAPPLTHFHESVAHENGADIFPERTESLPNGNFHSGHINFFVQALLDFLGRSVFKK